MKKHNVFYERDLLVRQSYLVELQIKKVKADS